MPVLRRPLEPGQYTSIAFGLRCREMAVRPSMGSVGDAYDNALCESFFATLECELLDRSRFRSQAEARMAVFDFIEGFYNPRRRHSALGHHSPIHFERTYGPRATTINLAGRAVTFEGEAGSRASADLEVTPVPLPRFAAEASLTPG